MLSPEDYAAEVKAEEAAQAIMDIMTTAAVASDLDVTDQCVRNYVRDGLLEPLDVGARYFIFSGREVDRFKRYTWPLLAPGPGKSKGSRKGMLK